MKKVRDGYKMTELGEIPEEWEVIKLNECGYIFGGNAFKSSNFTTEYKKDDYQVIRMGNVQLGKLDLNKNPVFLSDNLVSENEKKYLLSESDVLISLTGTVNKTDYGNVSWVDNNNKYLLNQRVACLRNANLLFNNRYYYYFLQSNIFRSQFFECGVGGTGNQANVSIADLNNIKVLKLPIIEQEKIASILLTVDKQIDNVDGLIEKNKELKKGLMQQLLTKGIGYTKFKKTDIGEIPEEWEINRLKQIIDVGPQNGLYKSKEFYTGNKYKIVELKDLYTKCKKININKLNNIDLNEKEAEQYKLNEGDLLVNRVSKAVDGIGRIKIFPNNRGVVCYESNMMRITLDYEVALSEFIYYLSESSIFRNQIMGTAKISNQTSISQGDLEKILICLPNIKEQEHIVRILSEVDTKIEGYENKKHKLEELKKGLMQQLLTGRTRVI